MHTFLQALAPAQAALGLVFLLSGAAKLRSPGSAAKAMDALGLEKLGAQRAITAAFPWLEMLLGAILALGWISWIRVAASAAALILLAAMTWLVVRAVRAGSQKSCNCFGASESAMSVWTVRRNYGFMLLALMSLASGFSPLHLTSFAPVIGGVLALAAAAASAYFLARDQLGSQVWDDDDAVVPAAMASADPETEEQDYIRRPNPSVVFEDLRDPGQHVTTLSLYAQEPVLVLNVSATCGACLSVLEREKEITQKLPFKTVYLFGHHVKEIPEQFAASELPMYRDMTNTYEQLAGSRGVPAATLLGADGLMAAGPEYGAKAIVALADEIAEALAEAEHPEPSAEASAQPAAPSDEKTTTGEHIHEH